MTKTTARRESNIGKITEQLLNPQSGSSEAQQSSYADELSEVQNAGVVSASKQKKPTPQKQKELTPSEQRAADAKARREESEAARREEARVKQQLEEQRAAEAKARRDENLRLEQARIRQLEEQRAAEARERREQAIAQKQNKYEEIVARDEERQDSARGLVEERILDTQGHNLNGKEGFYDRHISGSNSPRSPRAVSELPDDEVSETQSQISEADRAKLSVLKSKISRESQTQNQYNSDLGVGAGAAAAAAADVEENLPEAFVLRNDAGQILTSSDSQQQFPTRDEEEMFGYEEEEVDSQDHQQMQTQQQNFPDGARSSLLGDLPALQSRASIEQEAEEIAQEVVEQERLYAASAASDEVNEGDLRVEDFDDRGDFLEEAEIARQNPASAAVAAEPLVVDVQAAAAEGAPVINLGTASDIHETSVLTASAAAAAAATLEEDAPAEAEEDAPEREEDAPEREEDAPEREEDAPAVGEVDDDLEETLTAVSERTIKIDPNRAALFKEAQQIFAEVEDGERTVEERQKQFKDFLERADVEEMMENDTSFGVFAKIAQDVIDTGDEDATKEDKDKFLKDLTEKFGFLGEEGVDPANKEAEKVKMFGVYGKTHDHAQFGEIVVEKFQEAFGPMIEAFRAAAAAGVAKDGGKKGKAADAEEEVEDAATKQQKQNKEIDERDEKEKQDQAAKSRSKLLLEELTAGDVGKGALAITTIIVCSVMLPGVGTALALAAVSAAYVATAKGKPEQEKESEEVDPKLASANAAVEAAMKKGRESVAGTNISGVTQEFVANNSQELEDEKKALEDKRSKLVAQNGKATKDKEQITATAATQEEEEEVDSPDLEGLSPEQIAALKAAKKAIGASATGERGLEGGAIPDSRNRSRESEL